MTTLREAGQQALEALEETQRHRAYTQGIPDAITALRAALAQPEPRNQCGETCERAKLCAVCARGLDGAAQTPCDIAEDGVCEVIDCCRKSPLILEALEIGYDSAQAEAAQYHAAMAGYRPERHAAMDADVAKIAKAITAVKAALAQEEQEPVACECHRCIKEKDLRDPSGMLPLNMSKMILCAECGNKRCPKASDHMLACTGSNEPGQSGSVYAHPPRREWQGLTDKEIRRMGIETPGQQGGWNLAFARAVEAKLKEKNT